MENNKKVIVKIGTVFITILLLLTFFSSTIYNFNLPSVSVGFPEEGIISNKAESSGIVELSDEFNILSEIPGQIEIFVNQSDFVEEGTPLYKIIPDTSALNLENKELELKQNNINTDRIKSQIQNLNKKINSANKTEKEILTSQLSDLNFQLISSELIQETLSNEINDIKRIISDEHIVYANQNSVVNQIYFDNLSYVTKNNTVMKLASINGTFSVKMNFSRKSDFIKINDNVNINIPATGRYNINGVIKDISIENNMITASMEFSSDDLKGGEIAEVTIENVSELKENILPSTAVLGTYSNAYVLTVERQKGSFGYDYVVRQINVFKESFDDRKTSIITNAEFINPIVINSDRPISDGDRVKIVDGSELIGSR